MISEVLCSLILCTQGTQQRNSSYVVTENRDYYKLLLSKTSFIKKYLCRIFFLALWKNLHSTNICWLPMACQSLMWSLKIQQKMRQTNPYLQGVYSLKSVCSKNKEISVAGPKGRVAGNDLWDEADTRPLSALQAIVKGFSGGACGQESICAGDIRDAASIPRSGRSPGEGHGNPLQYSCLENPMDRGAWWATVHSVAKSLTWLTRLSTHPDHYKELGFYSFQNTNICRVLRRYKPSVVYQSVSRHKLIYAELGGIREEVAQVISTHLMTGGLWAMCQKNMKMWIALGRQRWGKIARRTAKK